MSPLPRCCSSHHSSGLKQQRCHEINRKQIHLQLPQLAKGHPGSLFRASSCRCCREDREPLWELGALLGRGHGCHSPLWRPLGLLCDELGLVQCWLLSWRALLAILALQGYGRACAEPSRLCLSHGEYPQNVSACCQGIAGRLSGEMGRKICC